MADCYQALWNSERYVETARGGMSRGELPDRATSPDSRRTVDMTRSSSWRCIHLDFVNPSSSFSSSLKPILA